MLAAELGINEYEFYNDASYGSFLFQKEEIGGRGTFSFLWQALSLSLFFFFFNFSSLGLHLGNMVVPRVPG